MLAFPASLVSSAFEIHGDCNLHIAGTSEKKSTSVIEMPSLDLKTTMGITEALRLQMEVQKQLHEQLEIQRKLQLRIEEQGKYLEMMFERMKDIGKDLKVSSSITDEHPSLSTETKHSPPNDKSEALEKDPVSSTIVQVQVQEGNHRTRKFVKITTQMVETRVVHLRQNKQELKKGQLFMNLDRLICNM
ncbi:protein PHOSPHATE STARVATION RESPONSE 1-like [Capsicum annuum]|uniref:protein PHOSPHATE STARVATION RESPONSE 1-like n=1 Tax=Capsicum annuum TaxID=4072 RepID=UPI0007BF0167|nr:protein PHOSPHATE STARVATION RESPONSE 1-like [Capsicum annuum]